MKSEAITTEQKAAKWDEQQKKSKLYWLKYQAEIKILRRKCADAGITVSPAEIEAELKKS